MRFVRDACGCVWDRSSSSWWSSCPPHLESTHEIHERIRIDRIINSGALARGRKGEST